MSELFEILLVVVVIKQGSIRVQQLLDGWHSFHVLPVLIGPAADEVGLADDRSRRCAWNFELFFPEHRDVLLQVFQLVQQAFWLNDGCQMIWNWTHPSFVQTEQFQKVSVEFFLHQVVGVQEEQLTMFVPLLLVVRLVIELVVLEIPKGSKNFLHDHVSPGLRFVFDFGGLDSIAENLNQQVLVMLVHWLLACHEVDKGQLVAVVHVWWRPWWSVAFTCLFW